MKCFYVLVHGQLDWSAAAPVPEGADEGARPAGFYCHRYVLAATAEAAQVAAFGKVRKEFEDDGLLQGGAVTLRLEADEVMPAPIYKLFERDSGRAFYDTE